MRYDNIAGLSLDAPLRKQYEARNKLYRAYHYLFFPNKQQPAALETMRILMNAIEGLSQELLTADR